ncbi:DUF3617 domain-containing protein [Reyranella sp.]|uniref:DUF3617 domain-containing protein n=1 Tax=Reyranella sp. TaxID=1929291 RepID=UPI003BAC36CD
MRLFLLPAAVAVSMIAVAAGAQTAIQAGEWETTEKTEMEGMQPMQPSSKKVCLAADEAQLERLLFPTPDEIKQHGCKYEPGAKKAGVLAATLTCPPNDQTPGVTAKAEITYTQTSYQGVGELVAADKSGTTVKGKSALSGKRLGDCPK